MVAILLRWHCANYSTINTALRWHHNGRDGVSNHQPHDCLLNRLFRHRSKKTSELRLTGLCPRWIPHTKGQLRGKCFHLMTSSWYSLMAIALVHGTRWFISFLQRHRVGIIFVKTKVSNDTCVISEENMLIWSLLMIIFLARCNSNRHASINYNSNYICWLITMLCLRRNSFLNILNLISLSQPWYWKTFG